MITQITFFSILGLPVIAWGGIITLLLFVFTALIAVLNQKGNHIIPFKWHGIVAKIAITLAIIHGILGILMYI